MKHKRSKAIELQQVRRRLPWGNTAKKVRDLRTKF